MNIAERLRRIFYPLFPIQVVRNPHESLQSVAEKYNQPEEVCLHSQDVKAGLEDWEKIFLSSYMQQKGRVLDIGCGAGREAIALAKLDFEVTGIDPANNMIEAAIRNAESSGVKIKFEVKSATEIDYSEKFFDYVIFSRAIYSYIPTRDLRIKVLQLVRKVLKPDGIAVFSAYYFGKKRWFSRTYVLAIIRKYLRFIFKERFKTEPGDVLFRSVSEASDTKKLCFGHFFFSPGEIIEEIQAADLKVIEGEESGFWVVRP